MEAICVFTFHQKESACSQELSLGAHPPWLLVPGQARFVNPHWGLLALDRQTLLRSDSTPSCPSTLTLSHLFFFLSSQASSNYSLSFSSLSFSSTICLCLSLCFCLSVDPSLFLWISFHLSVYFSFSSTYLFLHSSPQPLGYCPAQPLPPFQSLREEEVAKTRK